MKSLSSSAEVLATPPTREQIKAAIEMVMVVGDTIRDLGSVPSGELYAQRMGHMQEAIRLAEEWTEWQTRRKIKKF